ncbi:hypothetical protein CLAFUW4_00156 [Fulvia fulva]|uniref:DUF1214 domain-containing protein n=1 Tax=Passalora fulva TaxID=5499 RepID=A0A9Q8L831_PASFU|nr:uncharacterized protein CLAFUR5_00154 [Fulvia fulva]KAK4634601.1 hypothetical protein CLAFUR4_00156 [Fulvia fulva]KAK4637515.1 hypothetical protein CLAFUR0_00154 [Fulvia fulva]UJO12522.1 hypothetical protein CLAFUR5_00154 [Fulvia fulva]WPV10134.1 hypothetical protein CLAFUW4_00156 [Fulvia fulva]WPV24083.1 hypothetical protein CLAFUW7_00156 [Fulvia fulva]
MVSTNKDRAEHFPNVILCKPSAKQLFIRNVIGDWNEETPDALTVTLLGPRQHHVPPSDDDIVAAAKRHLIQCIFFYGFGALIVKTLTKRPNRITNPSQSSWLGTLTTQASAFGHFSLRDDEALVLTLRTGHASYWVVPFTSMGMITLRPDRQITSTNSVQSKQNEDGAYTIVVSDIDVGAPNWITTQGRTNGTVMVRWHGLPADQTSAGSVAVESRVVRSAVLQSVLWTLNEHVGPDERNAQNKARRDGYARLHFALPVTDSQDVEEARGFDTLVTSLQSWSYYLIHLPYCSGTKRDLNRPDRYD